MGRAGCGLVEVLGRGICAAPTLHIGEHAVAAFAVDGVERILELFSVVHQATFNSPRHFFFIIARPAMASNVSIVAPAIKDRAKSSRCSG